MLFVAPIAELLYVDSSGTRAALTTHYPIGTTEAAILSAAEALGVAVSGVSDGVLVGLRITYKARPDASERPDAGASVKRSGVFIFRDEDDTALSLVSIPGIKDEVLETSGAGAGILIDTSNVDVTLLIAQLNDIGFVNPFNQACRVLVSAYRQSRV